MAESSWPSTTHTVVSLAEYEPMAHPQAPDGLIGAPTDAPALFADGTGTRVSKVRANTKALVRGFGYDSGSTVISLTHAANGTTATRMDAVVIRHDRPTFARSLAIVQGVAGAGVPAVLQSSANPGQWDLLLGYVAVAPGATVFTADKVTPAAWYVGEDGQILCTSTTRPPHAPGRRIRETDTSRTYESTGSEWAVLLDDSGPSALSMASGFTAQRNVLRRRNGFVTAQLSFRRSSTMTADQVYTVATIPAGFRPVADMDALGGVSGLTLGAEATVTAGGAFTVKVSETLNVGQVTIHPMTWPVAA